MGDFNLSYREVIPNQTFQEKWKEFSVNSGGSQGTLQDIKVAERANGYCYKNPAKHHTRNRFIYWRIHHDILELVEHSLDISLSDNRLRYRFVDTPILDGVSVHETFENVLILVPTVCSVHRLVFPHPDRYHRLDNGFDSHPDLAAPSIFAEATLSDTRNPSTYYFFSNTSSTNPQLPHLADSCLSLANDEQALFLLGYPSGDIMLVKLSKNGHVDYSAFKNESFMPKFLSGLAGKLRNKDRDSETIVSLLLLQMDLLTYALVLMRNGQLKIWTCEQQIECVSVMDVGLEGGYNTKNQLIGTHNHTMRKANDNDEDTLIAIFMSYANESVFHIFRPHFNHGIVRMIRLNTLYSPQDDFIDFSVSSERIWSIWRGTDGTCKVYTASLQICSHWLPVQLENIPDENEPPTIEGETDPAQAYLQLIFHPGRFPLQIISKALNVRAKTIRNSIETQVIHEPILIYKRTTVVTDTHLTLNALKQQIKMAIESEMQIELKEAIVNDNDYIECATVCWQRFYSCCVQYYIAGLKPLGFLYLPTVSGAVLLKKSTISLLRPMDPMEFMFLCNDNVTPLHYDSISADPDVSDDIVKIFQVIVYLDQQLSELFSYTFEKQLHLLNSPDVVMTMLLEKIQTEMDNEFTEHVANMLNSCRNLYQAMKEILKMLRVENIPKTDRICDDGSQSFSLIFISHLGISFVVNSLKQQIYLRFIVCRNLLLISNILLMRNEITSTVLEAIRSICTPEISILTQINYVMYWLCNLPVLPTISTEVSVQRLSPLKLTPVFNLHQNLTQSVSLLEFFTGSTGGYEARKILAQFGCSKYYPYRWHTNLLTYLNCLYLVTWPLNNTTIFAEWLLSCGQHLWLQQLHRLLSTLADCSNCTLNYLLGVSFLSQTENFKALELFQCAAKGIFSDRFLMERHPHNSKNESYAYVNYYLRVINLYEIFHNSECTIHVANTALSVIDHNDPYAATLYSIKFKHHLLLKNYQLAYDALNLNPDNERKKDNLRDLVKKLLDERKLDILMKFNHGKLEQLFTGILYTRARATDTVDNIFYDFLYAYYVKKGPTCFRAAANVMYEQGYRLNDLNTMESIEKQVNCYLTAEGLLHLCDPEYAWVMIPNDEPIEYELKLKKDSNSGIIVKDHMKIVSLDDLKKEVIFCHGKWRLFKCNPELSTTISGPEELVTSLAASSLFNVAFEICKKLQLDSRQLFELLTKKCVLTTKYEPHMAIQWLAENDIQDATKDMSNVVNIAWRYLQSCIDRYEVSNMSTIHQAVSRQLIRMHKFLPEWLVDSYKKRNPAELLRLFFNEGRLQEAIEIANGLMLAAMGYGKDHYGFTTAMLPTAQPFCLPLNYILNLIRQLELINEMKENRPYENEVENLKEVFKTYNEMAMRTSNEMCQYRLSLITD